MAIQGGRTNGWKATTRVRADAKQADAAAHDALGDDHFSRAPSGRRFSG